MDDGSRAVGDGKQHVVIDLAATDGCHVQQFPGGRLHVIHARQQHIAQRRGQEAVLVGAGGEQLLDEEGVAVRTPMDVLQRGSWLIDPGDVAYQLRGFRRCQRLQVQAFHPFGSIDLGDPGPKWMPPRDLVGADRADDDDRLVADGPEQEGRCREGSGISPVQVLQLDQ